MKKWLMAVLFGTMLVLGACGGGGDDASEPDAGDNGATTEDSGEVADASAAEDLYKASCASCHGNDLSGGVGPALNTIGNDLSADEIEEIILNGVGTMPAGLLSGDDARTVAEWLAEQK